MNSIRFEIDPFVAENFPHFRVGGFVCNDLDQVTASLPLTAPLRLDEALTIQNLVDDPRIAAWRKAFQGMGLRRMALP